MTQKEFLDLYKELINLPNINKTTASHMIGVGYATLYRWDNGMTPSKQTVLAYGANLKRLVAKLKKTPNRQQITQQEFLDLYKTLTGFPNMNINIASQLIGMGYTTLYKWGKGGTPSKQTVLAHGAKLKMLVVKLKKEPSKQQIELVKKEELENRLTDQFIDMLIEARHSHTIKELGNIISVDKFRVSKWTLRTRRPRFKAVEKCLPKLRHHLRI